jgi:hypothetical protein
MNKTFRFSCRTELCRTVSLNVKQLRLNVSTLMLLHTHRRQCQAPFASDNTEQRLDGHQSWLVTQLGMTHEILSKLSTYGRDGECLYSRSQNASNQQRTQERHPHESQSHSRARCKTAGKQGRGGPVTFHQPMRIGLPDSQPATADQKDWWKGSDSRVRSAQVRPWRSSGTHCRVKSRSGRFLKRSTHLFCDEGGERARIHVDTRATKSV